VCIVRVAIKKKMFRAVRDFLIRFAASRPGFTPLRHCVVFDIDDTLIRTDDGTLIEPVHNLLNLAKRVGYRVVILTARPGNSDNRCWTEMELKHHGIEYDAIRYTSMAGKSVFKNELIKRGYNIVLSVGDQWTDLTDTREWLKLPSRYDPQLRTSIACHS